MHFAVSSADCLLRWELLDLSCFSGLCFTTMHATVVPCFRSAVHKGALNIDAMAASGQQMSLCENFDELTGPTLSPAERLHCCSEGETWQAAGKKSATASLFNLPNGVISDPCPTVPRPPGEKPWCSGRRQRPDWLSQYQYHRSSQDPTPAITEMSLPLPSEHDTDDSSMSCIDDVCNPPPGTVDVPGGISVLGRKELPSRRTKVLSARAPGFPWKWHPSHLPLVV